MSSGVFQPWNSLPERIQETLPCAWCFCNVPSDNRKRSWFGRRAMHAVRHGVVRPTAKLAQALPQPRTSNDTRLQCLSPEISSGLHLYTERKRIRESFGSRDSVLRKVPYLLQRCSDATCRSCRLAGIPAKSAPRRQLVGRISIRHFPSSLHNGFVEMKFVEIQPAKPAF